MTTVLAAAAVLILLAGVLWLASLIGRCIRWAGDNNETDWPAQLNDTQPLPEIKP